MSAQQPINQSKEAPYWYKTFCYHCLEIQNKQHPDLISLYSWQVSGYLSALLATNTISSREYSFLCDVKRTIYQNTIDEADRLKQENLQKQKKDDDVINEGFNDYLKSKTIKDNPYPEDTEQHNDWNAGWTHCCHALPF